MKPVEGKIKVKVITSFDKDVNESGIITLEKTKKLSLLEVVEGWNEESTKHYGGHKYIAMTAHVLNIEDESFLDIDNVICTYEPEP